MPSKLDEIVANKQEEVQSRRLAHPFDELVSRVQPIKSEFIAALSGAGIKLIAEIKPKSPSAGQLAESVDLESVIASYSRYASAISVLTDARFFGGSLETLNHVSGKSKVPTLCKEFVIEPYQIYEAVLHGAQAVLLIVKILEPAQLSELVEVCRQLGITPLIEIQNEHELEEALNVSPEILLINNRDLSTFEISFATTRRLSNVIPTGLPFVSASGIESRNDIDQLLTCTNKFLVGSSLMRSADLDGKMRELCGISK